MVSDMYLKILLGEIFKKQMMSKVISTDAIIDLMKEQSSVQLRYVGALSYGFTEAKLKSVVEQILQICSNNINVPPQLNKPDVVICKELLEQKLNEEQKAFGEPYFYTDKERKHIENMNAIRIVIELISEPPAL